MSIWSTILTLEPIIEPDYGPGKGEAGGYVDVAHAETYYAGQGLRFTIAEPTRERHEAECLLTREQITQLRDVLTKYLDDTKPKGD